MSHNPRPALEHPDLRDVSLVDALAALADTTRLMIVRTLYAEPAGRPCGTFPVRVAPSTLSHHFKVLREAGIIHQEERGNQRWTALRREDLDQRFPGLLAMLAAEALDAV